MRRVHYSYAVSYVLALLYAAFLCSGCGFVSIFGTPTRHERKIAAEYELTEHAGQKLLVLINQPAWLNARVNLRYHLTRKMNENLAKKIKIRPEYLVSYDELSAFRTGRPSFHLLSPTEVAAALSADMVLFVTIEGYELDRIAETNYYKGSLSAHSILCQAATGRRVWPESEEGKRVKVGFEIESRGHEAAVDRLADDLAHCIVRYFYDCPEAKFKIADDRSEIDWESPQR